MFFQQCVLKLVKTLSIICVPILYEEILGVKNAKKKLSLASHIAFSNTPEPAENK